MQKVADENLNIFNYMPTKVPQIFVIVTSISFSRFSILLFITKYKLVTVLIILNDRLISAQLSAK